MGTKWYEFDPKKSFLTLPILWVVVGIITGTALIIGAVICINTPLMWRFSAEGFNNFLALYKVPLGITALIIPIVALLAANHRSEQTKEQILLNSKQNSFSNYFKHLEEFERYINSHTPESLRVGSVRRLHGQLFPEAREGVYKIDESVLSNIEYVTKRLIGNIEEFDKGYKSTLGDALHGIAFQMRVNFQAYGITYAGDATRFTYAHSAFEVYGKTYRELIKVIKAYSLFLVHAMQFDHKVELPKELNELSRLVVNNAPDIDIAIEDNGNPISAFENFRVLLAPPMPPSNIHLDTAVP